MIFNIIIGIWVTAGILMGFAKTPAVQLVDTPIAFMHIPMAITMEVAFLGAAIYGGLWLARRRPGDDAMSLAFAEIGLWFGLIATTTGSIWAKVNWNAYWSWDPQQTGIVATLLTYAALFALRNANDDENKARDLWAVYAIFGFIAAIFWTYMFRRLLPTLHPENIMAQSDDTFKTVLRFNYLGFILLMIRIVQLRARVERASLRLREMSWM